MEYIVGIIILIVIICIFVANPYNFITLAVCLIITGVFWIKGTIQTRPENLYKSYYNGICDKYESVMKKEKKSFEDTLKN